MSNNLEVSQSASQFGTGRSGLSSMREVGGSGGGGSKAREPTRPAFA